MTSNAALVWWKSWTCLKSPRRKQVLFIDSVLLMTRTLGWCVAVISNVRCTRTLSEQACMGRLTVLLTLVKFLTLGTSVLTLLIRTFSNRFVTKVPR